MPQGPRAATGTQTDRHYTLPRCPPAAWNQATASGQGQRDRSCAMPGHPLVAAPETGRRPRARLPAPAPTARPARAAGPASARCRPPTARRRCRGRGRSRWVSRPCLLRHPASQRNRVSKAAISSNAVDLDRSAHNCNSPLNGILAARCRHRGPHGPSSTLHHRGACRSTAPAGHAAIVMLSTFQTTQCTPTAAAACQWQQAGAHWLSRRHTA